MFEQEYWIRPGNALLLKRDENGKILRMGMSFHLPNFKTAADYGLRYLIPLLIWLKEW